MKRPLLVLLVALASMTPARAAPVNDHYFSPVTIEAMPFETDLDLRGARRELDFFAWDCMPDDTSPATPVTPRYGDAWYRFTSTGPTQMLVTASGPTTTHLGLYLQTPNGPSQDWCDWSNTPGDPASFAFSIWQPGVYLLQVGTCLTCGGSTEVHLTVTDAPSVADLAVENLTVTRPTISTPAVDVPLVVWRRIEFDLAAISGSAPSGIWHVRACHQHDAEGDYCIDVDRGLTGPMAAGARQSVAVEWNAASSGSVGDFTICATVSPFDFVESDGSNNLARAATWIAVGNTGVGESVVNLAYGGFTSCYWYQ